MLSAVFFLGAVLAYHKVLDADTAHNYISPSSRYHWQPCIWLAACVACGAVATLCKEQGITCLGVCVVHDTFTAGRIFFQKDKRRRSGQEAHCLFHYIHVSDLKYHDILKTQDMRLCVCVML